MLVTVLDSASITGGRKTGIAFNAAGLTCYYKRSSGTAALVAAINTITTLGTFAGSAIAAAWKEVDAANQPGVYELHLPNDAIASGANDCVVSLKGAAGMEQVDVVIEIEVAKPAEVFARLGAPTGASIAADVAARASQTSVSANTTALTNAAIAAAAHKAVSDAVKAKTDNLPSDPASTTNMSGVPVAVRTNLAIELARIDAAVSTRAPEFGGRIGNIDGTLTTIASKLPATTVASKADVDGAILTVAAPTFTGTVTASPVTVNPTTLAPAERTAIATAANAVITAAHPGDWAAAGTSGTGVPLGYVRITSAVYGEYVAGTIVDVYSTNEPRARIGLSVVVAINGTWHYDLPLADTYTLEAQYPGRAPHIQVVTT